MFIERTLSKPLYAQRVLYTVEDRLKNHLWICGGNNIVNYRKVSCNYELKNKVKNNISKEYNQDLKGNKIYIINKVTTLRHSEENVTGIKRKLYLFKCLRWIFANRRLRQ